MSSQLASAARHAARGRLDRCLGDLLARYGAEPRAALADAIAALGAQVLDPTLLESLRGKGDDARRRWRELAPAQRLGELDALLATWRDVPGAEAAERAELLLAWPADPRRDRAVLAVLRETPFRTTGKFWTRLYKLAAAIADPTLAGPLRELPAIYARDFARRPTAKLPGRVAAVVEGLLPRLDADAAAELEPDERAELDSIRQVLDARTAAKTTKRAAAAAASGAASADDLEALLARVLEAPANVERRRVYADALAAAGHDRGELITLQLRLAEDPPQDKAALKTMRAREKALLEALHGEILGPLEPVLMRRGLEVSAGFVRACAVDTQRPQRVDDVRGHPLWATVEVLGGPATIFLHPVMRSLRELSVPGSPAHTADLVALLDHEGELAVQTLRCYVNAQNLARLGGCGALPALRHLHVNGCNHDPDALLDQPLCSRLEQLTLEIPWGTWPKWLPAWCARLGAPAVTIRGRERSETIELALRRDSEGRASATIPFAVPSNKHDCELRVAAVVSALGHLDPAAFAAVELQPSRRIGDKKLAKLLERAATRFG